ncbi:MAG: hypothetical protein ACFCVA_15360 [Gammaproteobacteria bacterium]
MTEYRRAKIQGATYSFTVDCAERHGNHEWVDAIDRRRQSLRKIKSELPFEIDAMGALSEDLHCIWTLSAGALTTRGQPRPPMTPVAALSLDAIEVI